MTRPMAVPRLIPLAPRPFSGESMRSWIARVAARYDLASPELVARLRDGPEVDVSRLSAIDWQEDAALDHLLAQVVRLDEARIRALRLVVTNRPEPALWHRRLLAWCPACACEDVVRYGEIHERAVWRLGCYAVCPAHRLVLTDVCPSCSFGSVRFQAVAGRQRLVCTLCKRPVDASPDIGRGVGMLYQRDQSELVQCPDRIHLVLALQTVLIGVAGGAASTDLWGLGIPALDVAVVVRDLAAALSWSTWLGLRSRDAIGTIAAACDHGFAVLQPRIAFEVLATIATVFAAVGQVEGVASGGAAESLRWFIRSLPIDEQRWLKARANGWGPVLAQVVGDAVAVEEEARRRAIAAREQAQRDSAWLRHATARYADDARRRIAARAAKRKAAALKRKPASSKTKNPHEEDPSSATSQGLSGCGHRRSARKAEFFRPPQQAPDR